MQTNYFVFLAAIAIHSTFETPAVGEEPKPPTDYTKSIARLEEAVREELIVHKLHGMAVALVDDQQIVYSAGFGNVQARQHLSRGSISKLFNAVAVMQLVEQGKLDLDAPIESYGPQFKIVVPFENVPARHPAAALVPSLGHDPRVARGRLLRFPGTGPGGDRSLDPLLRARQPAQYENPLFEHRTVDRRPDPRDGRRRGLCPLSAGTPPQADGHDEFIVPPGRHSAAAAGKVLYASGRRHGGFVEQEAPVFNLGTIPAGNLFTTAEDLGPLCLDAGCRRQSPRQQIVSPATLDQMWTPQLTKDETGFGLGFMVGKFRKHKAISHNGAVYGHSASLRPAAGAKNRRGVLVRR